MITSEKSHQNLSDYIQILLKNIFEVNEILKKFNDFVNSDDCIGKITSKPIRLYPIFIKKNYLNLKKKGITYSKTSYI